MIEDKREGAEGYLHHADRGLPPNFNLEVSKEPLIGLKQKIRDMTARVRKIENLADAIMVADMKDSLRLELSSVYTAAVLKDELGVEVIPVMPTADMNRKAMRTMFLTALSLGLESIALVWGDRYAEGENTKNVYDFKSLAEAVGEMRALSDRADINTTLLSPVDVSSLNTTRGLRIARSRLRKGADCLLAQPPTADLSVHRRRAYEARRGTRDEGPGLPERLPLPQQGGREDVQAAVRMGPLPAAGAARGRRREAALEGGARGRRSAQGTRLPRSLRLHKGQTRAGAVHTRMKRRLPSIYLSLHPSAPTPLILVSPIGWDRARCWMHPSLDPSS